MPPAKPFNLFVYGTLMNPSVFRAVVGRDFSQGDGGKNSAFRAREAVLHGYKKVSPDNTYLYAVPDPHGRIRGLLIGPMGPECLEALRQYEGRNYRRKAVRVQTRDGRERAVVFVGNLEQLEHSFGYGFHDPFKQEVLLQEKIDAALLEAEREHLHTETPLARRALGELRGDTIRDLVRTHFDSGGISDYAIRHSLTDAPLRDYSPILSDPAAAAMAPNYLGMVIRQVIFNQIEERVYRDFRYELDHMADGEECYRRTISSVTALRMLNANPDLLTVLVADGLKDLNVRTDHLLDFVQWSIAAADSVYDRAPAGRHLRYLGSHMGRGDIPLGAELEFSNIGHAVIADPRGERIRDPQYDGFLYFSDFALDVLTWKLGGHVDDHQEKFSDRRRRGFFEAALGNLSIKANLSKPITRDPWTLNQFIHEVRRFYEIAPHSVHLSLQLRTRHRPVQDRTPPLYVLKCLFAIAGGPVVDADGAVRISRLATEEITGQEPGHQLLFSDVRKRYSVETDEEHRFPSSPAQEGRYVQQYRFLRLGSQLNYEPIIMALKGVQIALSPGSFLTPAQHQSSAKHRRLAESLLSWGRAPDPISDKRIESFLGHVHHGLMTERRGRPAHSEAYVAWSLAQLRRMVGDFNAMVDRSPVKRRSKLPARGRVVG